MFGFLLVYKCFCFFLFLCGWILMGECTMGLGGVME